VPRPTKPVLVLALLLASMCSAGLAYAQQLRLDDTPSTDLTSAIYQRLPLDEPQRSSLRTAVQARQ